MPDVAVGPSPSPRAEIEARGTFIRHVSDTLAYSNLGKTLLGVPILIQIARSELARPVVDASVERFSRAKQVFNCILLQSSILHRLSGCIRSVSGSASDGVQGHSVNARMQTYANAKCTSCACELFVSLNEVFLRFLRACIRTPLSRRVYEVEHGCRGAARVPGSHT